MGFHKNLRGKDLHAPSAELIENNTGSTLPQLKIVSLSGMGTSFPQVVVCNPNFTTAFGVVQDDILPAKPGYITVLGFMFQINTSAWPVGTALYADSSGNLSSSILGAVVAFVVQQHATEGVLYVTAGTAFSDPGTGGVPWEVNGNIGLHPVNSFLGNTDAVPVNFRTNNIERMTLDINGRLGIGTHTPERTLDLKSHTSANASGLQVDTFYVETSDTANNPAITIPISDPSSVKIEFHVTARQTDGGARASFTRSGLFYREASNVQSQGGWTSDFTQRSNSLMNVSYTLNVGSVTFRVKAASATVTRWAGHVKVQQVF